MLMLLPGWSVVNALTATEGFMHYVYVRCMRHRLKCCSDRLQTFPAVAIAMLVTSIWAWTDFEIKKMQVSRHDSPTIYFAAHHLS